MGTRDPRIDAYIAKSADFAKPILTKLRALVHEGCPEVEETLKWSHPSFEYKGMFAGMAAFKQHCAFGFWKHTLVVGDDPKAKEAMGSFGCLKELSDLPPKAEFLRSVKKAMQLNDEGIKVKKPKHKRKPAPEMHPRFKAALAKKKKALANFEAFSPSQQREYLEWIAEAKAEATRDRRIEQAVEWLAENKPRNWKYMNC
ncbi:MAG TPA: YdeI/OmpD-associated family protein [Planctomycetota bacterium]|nr:YdeI/OmpD-associated family protein [Planctomycetota bacterium]